MPNNAAHNVTGSLNLAPVALGLVRKQANTPTILFAENFNGKTLPISGFGVGSQFGATHSIENDALKFTYPVATGENYTWANFNVPAGTKQVYIQFRAKMPSAIKHGLKFCKVFGLGNTSIGYANCTFGLDYTGDEGDWGDMYAVSYGDGSVINNDTSQTIKFDGLYHSKGRNTAAYASTVSTPQGTRWAATNWGADWHTFKLMVKFNDGTTAGNEVPNGEFYVEIDGVVYVNATGLFNRHYSNQDISHVGFGGWSQGNRGPFEIHYDDIVISTGGFI